MTSVIRVSFLVLLVSIAWPGGCFGRSWDNLTNYNVYKESDGCCSTFITDTHFRITNPSHPNSDSTTKRYSHVIQVQPNTCGLRVRYEDVQLSTPSMMSSAACSTDSITILAPDYPTQPQCGFLNNFQINVPTKSGDIVEILVVVQSTKYLWNMVISQVECGSVESKPLEKYKDSCGKRPTRTSVLWTLGISEFGGSIVEDEEESNNPEDENEQPVTIINDPDKFSCDKTGDLFRCHVNNVIDKAAAKTMLHNRIVNGQTAKRNSWPWQVVFLVKGKYLLCGGALISPNVAVTAGHCLAVAQKGLPLSDLIVATGVHRIGTPTYGAQYRRCKMATIHPHYSDVNDDISLCFFDEPIKVNDRIAPVCLPYEQDTTFAGVNGYITGWGKTTDGSGPASTLQEAGIPIVTNKVCEDAWEETGGKMFTGIIQNSMICGGGNNKSTCNGDSGGPLTVHDTVSNKYTLVGLTSFGPSSICNVPGKPLSVFTRVTSHLNFLSLALAESNFNVKDIKTYTPC